MRVVATVYWSRYDNTHHTVISEVADNGSHVVVNSSIHDNTGQTLDKVVGFWMKELGVANVRAYTIAEYVPGVDVGTYKHFRDNGLLL
jgi:hypothetical protein